MESWKLRTYFDYVHWGEERRMPRATMPEEQALRPLEYLSRDDRALFESVHDSDDPKDVIITRLLWKIARTCYDAHRASKY